jgi:ribose transport system substrate-binding protein
VTGEVRIGLLSGNPGNMVGYNRRSGFFQGLAEAQLIKTNTTNFRVLTQGWGGWAAEGGLKAAEDMLVAAPDINVIFAENDSMALGAITAIKNAGKEGQILVAGIDGQREALALIKEGTYGATGLNSPIELARTTVDIALRYLGGERGFPSLVNTTPACVSSENVDQYYNPDVPFGFKKQ